MKKILIIEDNLDVRENLVEIIEMAGYKTLAATNGKEGVTMAKETLPDLIICDIMMPELDGYGVINMLANEVNTASIPFLFLSAKAEATDIRKGMNLGADDYMTKPFDVAELLKTIEVRLTKSASIKKDQNNTPDGFESFINSAKTMDEVIITSADRKRMQFKKKQPIYSEGNLPRGVYLIEKGAVKCFITNKDDKDYIASIHKPGDYFGYIAILEDKPYSDNAEAIEETTLYFIPKDDFINLVLKNRLVAHQLLKMISGNVTQQQDRMIKLAYNSVRKRVAEGLIHLESTLNTKRTDQFILTISRQDLANMVGTASESVIRTLSDFKEEGLIGIKGASITILALDKLKNMKN